MEPAMQLTITAFGSVGAFMFALVIVAILVRRLGPQMDTAAEEHRILREGQKTLMERIERLRERPAVQQFIIVNSTRHDILVAAPGHIREDGMPVPEGKEMYKTLQQYPGVDVEILILKKGLGSLLSALPIDEN